MNFNEMKKQFRQKAEWKRFREDLKTLRKVDALTLSKLRKGWALHHLDLQPKNYTKLEEHKFECLNNKSHDVIHFLFTYYKKDKDILSRLQNILDKMILLNEGGNKNEGKDF